jgi:outer membrane protein assembly factor BamE (lipoprotein component of BamABCDE complex)
MFKMLKFLKKTTLIATCFLTILSCSYKPVITSSGVLNLDKRKDLVLIGNTNKNDVIQLLGEATLKEQPNENKWAYMQTIEQKKFGKKKIIKNTLLILEFDNRGILKSKKILNKGDFNQIKFDNKETISLGLNNSFSKRVFSSIRKRAQNRLDTTPSK